MRTALLLLIAGTGGACAGEADPAPPETAGGETAAPAAAPEPAPEPPPPPADEDAAILEGIREISETRHEIGRAAFDRLTNGQSEAMGALRIEPHEVSGRLVGVRLFGVRATGVWARLGLRNGDVVMRVAGHEVATSDGAMEAYGAVRAAGEFEVEIERSGQPLTLEYVVVDSPPP